MTVSGRARTAAGRRLDPIVDGGPGILCALTAGHLQSGRPLWSLEHIAHVFRMPAHGHNGPSLAYHISPGPDRRSGGEHLIVRWLSSAHRGHGAQPHGEDEHTGQTHQGTGGSARTALHPTESVISVVPPQIDPMNCWRVARAWTCGSWAWFSSQPRHPNLCSLFTLYTYGDGDDEATAGHWNRVAYGHVGGLVSHRVRRAP